MKSKARKVRPGGSFLRPRSRKEVAEQLEGLRKKRVLPKTLQQYRREWEKQKKFLKARGEEEMTVELFEDFVCGLDEEGLAGSTANHHLSAWKHELTVKGMPHPNEEQLKPVVDAIEGMKYEAGKYPGLPRGAMDSGQLAQLRYHCGVNGMIMYADGFAAIWHGMIRHSAAAAAQVHDARLFAAKGPMLHLPRKKAMQAKRCKSKNMSHFKHVENMASLFRSLTKGKKATDKLLPGWSQDCEGINKRSSTYF